MFPTESDPPTEVGTKDTGGAVIVTGVTLECAISNPIGSTGVLGGKLKAMGVGDGDLLSCKTSNSALFVDVELPLVVV